MARWRGQYNFRERDPDGLARWYRRTPRVVVGAIFAVFHSRGTEMQIEIVNEWVEYVIWDVPYSRIVQLIIDLDTGR
jgi:hypothetical protein